MDNSQRKSNDLFQRVKCRVLFHMIFDNLIFYAVIDLNLCICFLLKNKNINKLKLIIY